MVKVIVQSYDEATDVFTLAAFGFEPEHEKIDPDYCRSAPDFDDFEVPGAVLPAIIGEFGEPSELLGQVFDVNLP